MENKEFIFSSNFINFITKNKSQEYLNNMISGFRKICKELDNPAAIKQEKVEQTAILELANSASISILAEENIDKVSVFNKSATLISCFKELYPHEYNIAHSEFLIRELQAEKNKMKTKLETQRAAPLRSNISKRSKRFVKKSHKKKEIINVSEPAVIETQNSFPPAMPKEIEATVFQFKGSTEKVTPSLVARDLFGSHVFNTSNTFQQFEISFVNKKTNENNESRECNEYSEYNEWWNISQKTDSEVNNSADLQEIVNKFLN